MTTELVQQTACYMQTLAADLASGRSPPAWVAREMRRLAAVLSVAPPADAPVPDVRSARITAARLSEFLTRDPQAEGDPCV